MTEAVKADDARAAAVETLRAWIDSPDTFVREALGATPDWWQTDVLHALGTGKQRIALKACKGPGKSTVLAWAILWWLLTHPNCKVVATSVSEDNLRDGLWSELAKWLHLSPVLSAAFIWSRERIVSRERPETWWASARTWSRSADATTQANTLAGVHADHVLFVVDESGSIPRSVVATAEAGLANAGEEGRTATLIQAGNPTDVDGPLYDAFVSQAALWWTCEVTGDPDDPRRSRRVSLEWARQQIALYGRDNPWVQVNVFGKFPAGSTNALLSLEDARAATRVALTERDYFDEAKVLGVDVARFGDDRSVLQPRQGRAAFKPLVLRNLDTMALAGHVAQFITRWGPDVVFVDQTGIGAGVVDRLRQLGHDVVGVDFGARASTQRWANKRAEMWGECADWIRNGGAIPDDAELVAELSAPTYSFASDGRLKLESKEDLKRRGHPSPDKADALALTFAAPVAAKSWRRQSSQAETEYNPFKLEDSHGATQHSIS